MCMWMGDMMKKKDIQKEDIAPGYKMGRLFTEDFECPLCYCRERSIFKRIIFIDIL